MGFAKQQRMNVKTQEEGLRLAENGRHSRSPGFQEWPYSRLHAVLGRSALQNRSSRWGWQVFYNGKLSIYFAGY